MSDFSFVFLLIIVGCIVIFPFFGYILRDDAHDREFCQHINDLAFSNYSSNFDSEMIAFKKYQEKCSKIIYTKKFFYQKKIKTKRINK